MALSGFDAAEQANALTNSIRELGSPSRAASEQNYLKSSREFSGTPVPAIRSVVRTWQHSTGRLAAAELIGVVRALWAGPVFECRLAAVILLERNTATLTPANIGLLEELLRTSRTWALIDSLAANVAGDLVQRYPELTATLDRWAVDNDFWIRRSALLALLVPLRRGGGDFDRFAGYADRMLEEKEFFIRKAIGWVLRETAKRQPELVSQWLAPRVHRASGVTVREAIKPLPPDIAADLLTGYRERRPVTLKVGMTNRTTF